MSKKNPPNKPGRKDQAWFKFFPQDYLTDEKLRECKMTTVGNYSFMLCVLSKSEIRGTFLLKQNDKQIDQQSTEQLTKLLAKQSSKQVFYFAIKFDKHLPDNLVNIVNALNDLLDHDVIYIDGDRLIQKRMYNDFLLSQKRSLSGRKGGKATQKKAHNFAKAKHKAKSKANVKAPSDSDSDSNKIVYNTNNNNSNDLKNQNQNTKVKTVSDAEFWFTKNQLRFEEICMKCGFSSENGFEELHNHHLWLESEGKYPMTERQVLAGFERWLLNDTKFKNQKSKKYVTGKTESASREHELDELG